MKFSISTIVLYLAAVVASTQVRRQFCPQASRFGVISVSPTTVSPGDDITVTVDLNCAVNSFGIVPAFLDYTIEVPAAVNNGFEAPIVLARRTLADKATSDVFTAKVPFGNYFAGAAYQVYLRNTYPIKGTDGSSEVLVQGGISAFVTINV
ncbi:hypothetical protein DXG01_000579 [Tephrocybe rancida]|nr:hypothetical protein DXG01_000579 [Tephrocybe rancida]